MAKIFQTWFGVSRHVDRATYTFSGLVLAAIKYAVEAAAIWGLSYKFLTPWDFVNPLVTAREALLQPAPWWVWGAFTLWTLPFLWIAVSMSIRRAADAGASPWLGFVVLVPLINLGLMLVLCLWPSDPGDHWILLERRTSGRDGRLHAALCVAYSLVVGGIMVWLSVFGLSRYGGSLFLGTPLLMGAGAAYFYNRPASHSFLASAGIGGVSILVGFLGLLLFALEGFVCLAMAAPLAVPIAALGGLLGKAIADATRRPPVEIVTALLMLPLWAAGETWLAEPHQRVVLTSVEIDAPPHVVWQNVVSFPDLPAERAWYFRLGTACPERARITGTGDGATRYCEFTTGTFVEPITVWNEPSQLSFDVTEQPPPMSELSPYRHVHAPHLDGFLQSTRGEFRLIELPGGRTRLEGRTWYRNAMFPQWYWSAWSDLFIHLIHQRVLEHIQRLSEGQIATSRQARLQ